MLRIGIVDDHQLFRKSLAHLLDTFDNIQVVLQAENGKKLFELLKTVSIDLILLDIQMPEMDGFETCMQLRKKYPKIKVLIVSQLSTKESIHTVMKLGAHGFFTKNSNPEQLEEAIQSVQDKDFYFGQELGKTLREAILWGKSDDAMADSMPISLTPREVSVILMACKELNSMEIADRLCIDVRTVETHRKRIIKKTKSKNFIGAILFALKHHYITVDDF